MAINDLMDDLEMETKVMMVDGELRTIKEILDGIFEKDKKKKQLATDK